MTGALPAALRPQLEMTLGTSITSARPLGGGDISEVSVLETARGAFVLKATRRALPYLYFAEAQGLRLLGRAGNLTVPEVVSHGDGPGGYQYLLLTYLPPAPDTPEAHEALGRGLAALHRHSAVAFGGGGDNYFGSLAQANPETEDAASFYWTARLEPQLRLARPHLERADLERFTQVQARLKSLVPTEPPALVHGDLWHGNVLFTSRGPALIDPAAAFSHREVDLALMRLFGGFAPRVFGAYAEAYTPSPGWEERASLWQLYPLLAHVNMSGGSDVARLRRALNQTLNL